MDTRTTARRDVVCYLALTFTLSAIFYGWSLAGAPLGQVAPPLMWMPALAAVTTRLLFHRTVAGLGWRLGSWRYVALGAVIPIVYCLALYVPVWLTGLGQFNGAYLTRILPLLPLALLQGIVLTLGEEIGWRGLLVPALYRAGGFGWAGLASGLIWGLWHVPLIVVGGYDAGTPVWFGVPCFMVSVTAMGVMLAWVRLRSGSVWPSVAFHAVHNLAIQGVFDGSTIDTGPTKWLTTEFGIGLTVLTVIIGAYFWRRRAELPADLAPLPPRAGEGAGG